MATLTIPFLMIAGHFCGGKSILFRQTNSKSRRRRSSTTRCCSPFSFLSFFIIIFLFSFHYQQLFFLIYFLFLYPKGVNWARGCRVVRGTRVPCIQRNNERPESWGNRREDIIVWAYEYVIKPNRESNRWFLITYRNSDPDSPRGSRTVLVSVL